MNNKLNSEVDTIFLASMEWMLLSNQEKLKWS
jgi:phosphopantetheine adenylyltransferase